MDLSDGKTLVSDRIGCDNPVHSQFAFARRCLRCNKCLKHRRWVWIRRIQREMLTHKRNHFVRLSFRYVESEKAMMAEFTKYMKRVRKNYDHENLSFIAVAEYGEQNGRFHIHALFHTNGSLPTRRFREAWKAGQSHGKLAQEKHAGYIASYLKKKPIGHRTRCSQKYGLLDRGDLKHELVTKTLQHFPNARIIRVRDPHGALPRKLWSDSARHATEHGRILPNALRRCEAICRRFDPTNA